jgi:hypothetical protein
MPNLEDNSEEEEDIEYGICQTRRQTSYEYHDSSSLTPAQIMEQEVYYESAAITYEWSISIVQIICTLLPLLNHCNTILQYWTQLNTSAEHAITFLHSRITSLKRHIANLLVLLRWLKGYGELALLYAEDLSVFR